MGFLATILPGFTHSPPVVGRGKKIGNFMCQILGDPLSLNFDHFLRTKFAVYLVVVG